MSLEYSKAKNQSETCKWDSFFLHSTYNPETEAQRFADSLEPLFIPENIIVIEPALSYCGDYLRKKYPKSKIFCIRFIKDIKSYFSFDKTFYYNPDNIHELENSLFNYFGETGLLNSFFVSWPPSSKAFAEYDKNVWVMLKDLLKNCQSILATRQFFAKRWIKNQINNLVNLKHTATVNKVDVPVLVCASGTSLKDSLDKIKKLNDNFFIIACSSAIQALLKHNIIPDLCISTDGGFWAKKHLNCLLSETQNIKLAVPTEANVPQEIFDRSNVTIIPLAYCDNFDNLIYDSFGIKYLKAQRNGTISGTAVELALSLTKDKVFMCGIDLESSDSFVHTQPNALEIENSANDIKIKPIDNRTFIQGRDSTQLEIYRNWFINKSIDFDNRVFRLSDNHVFKNSLGYIKDISFDDLNNYIDSTKIKKENYFSQINEVKTTSKEIISYFKKLIENEQWIKNYYPADCLMIERTSDKNKKEEYIKRLNEKIEFIKVYLTKQEKDL